jgi:very-short-patch-repair endonuclease
MPLFCSACRKTITKGVYDFSMGNFATPLCMTCQKGKQKKIETRDETISALLRATPEALRLKTGLADKGWKVIHEDKDRHKHVDLAIREAKIVIEVDGSHHNSNSKQGISDIKRTFHDFVNNDIITLRIPNSVMNDNETIDETVKILDSLLNERIKKLEKEEALEKQAKFGRFVNYILYIFILYQITVYLGLIKPLF